MQITKVVRMKYNWLVTYRTVQQMEPVVEVVNEGEGVRDVIAF